MYLSELVDRLKVPMRSQESLSVYLKMPKAKQDNLKDVGGFVGGELLGGRRKNGSVKGRDFISLDLDSIPAGETDTTLKKIAALGWRLLRVQHAQARAFQASTARPGVVRPHMQRRRI